MSSDSYAIAMKETLLYLEGIREEDYNKIPKSLIKYLEENADPEYVCNFNPQTPLAELNLHEETYGLLEMLYYKYWCKSDEERRYYSKLLAKNEEIYNEQYEKSNYKNIFSNNESTKETINQEVMLEKVEENPFKRLLLKIKRFFKK